MNLHISRQIFLPFYGKTSGLMQRILRIKNQKSEIIKLSIVTKVSLGNHVSENVIRTHPAIQNRYICVQVVKMRRQFLVQFFALFYIYFSLKIGNFRSSLFPSSVPLNNANNYRWCHIDAWNNTKLHIGTQKKEISKTQRVAFEWQWWAKRPMWCSCRWDFVLLLCSSEICRNRTRAKNNTWNQEKGGEKTTKWYYFD